MLWYSLLIAVSCRSLGRYALTQPIMRARRRLRSGGWSNDCSWISSSFTIEPPSPEPMNDSVARATPSAPEDLLTPPRDMPIASISSMKPIAPPSLRAALRSALKNDRMR